MQDKNIQLLDSAPIPRAILTLAIPTVISNMITLIYNLTDTFFIGMLDDPIQLGAISLAFPVFLVIQAIGNIFSMGAPAYISRSLGAKEYEEVKRTSSVAHYIAITVIILISILFFILETPILQIIGTTEENIVPTREYLNVIIGLGFIITMQVVMPALLRAEGKVKEAMVGMIIGTGLNIILDPVFILKFHMGAAGAAWATVIGNFFAVVYYIWIFKKRPTNLSISRKYFKPSKRIVMEILKIGFPAAIAQIMMSVANILQNSLASGYGNNAVAAVGVSIKVLTMAAMIITGYSAGYMPFAGYNYGAKNMKRTLSAFWFTTITSTVACFILMIPFTLLGPAFMRAFTSSEEIIEIGLYCLSVQVFCVPVLGIQLTAMSTFQATGQAVKSLIVNLGRQCIFYMPALVICEKVWGFQGLMYAQVFGDYTTMLMAVILVIPLIKWLGNEKEKQENTEEAHYE